MVRLLAASLLSISLMAQQSSNGLYYPPPTPTTIPMWPSVQESCNPGSGASPCTFAFGTLPAGATIVISMYFAHSSSQSVPGSLTIGDGTGACGITSGSDTFTILPVMNNGTTSINTTYLAYATNIQTTQTNVIACYAWSGGSGAGAVYGAAVTLYGTLGLDAKATTGSGLVAGYVRASGSSGTTQAVTGMTTSGTDDILVCTGVNFFGSGSYTPGSDGHSGTYSLWVNAASGSVNAMFGVQETSNQSYSCNLTGPNAVWQVHLLAFSPTFTTGTPVNFTTSGRNYVQAQGGSGKVYSAAQAASCLLDANAGTNGATPTAANLFSGLRGGTACVGSSANIIVADAEANWLYTNAQQPLTLGTAAVVGGVAYSGNGGLAVGGVTSGSGASLAGAHFQTGLTASSTVPVNYGVTLLVSAPGIPGIDDGALGGLFVGSQYVVPHFKQAGSVPGQTVFMENQNGETAVFNLVTPSTVYNLNIQITPSGTNNMLLCDASNRMIYSWSAPASSSAGTATFIPGITGEEPDAVYTYIWSNPRIFLGTGFNPNGPCF